MGSVENIFVAPAGGERMQRVSEVEAVAGKGLAGDRYAERTGYWSGQDECQVTLIEGEGLDEIAGEVAVTDGQHRRNIVTRGIEFSDLVGQRFQIGGAVLEYDRPRPPCRYIQSLTEKGMTRALGKGRAGICARVLESGPIRIGDEIEVVIPISRSP